jgi:hypothetical protein
MRTRILFTLLTFVCFVFAFVACQPRVQQVEVTRTVLETVVEVVEGETVEVEVTREVALVVPSVEETTSNFEPAGNDSPSAPGNTAANNAQPAERLIIKTGEMELEAADAAEVTEQATTIVTAAGGYIVSQRVWESNGYTYATMQYGVPVDQFEQVMLAFRQLGRVTMDVAAGQDVTDEFVDLTSRLDNLLATQQRLREFLDSAKTVKDILEVNKELTAVEEELNIIQGRMTYLADRAAFSTISLKISPIIPTRTPAPPTPTPTPTPLPTPATWRPGDTARIAAVEFQENAQTTADWLIYNLIVYGPCLFVLLVIAFFVRRYRQRL